MVDEWVSEAEDGDGRRLHFLIYKELNKKFKRVRGEGSQLW